MYYIYNLKITDYVLRPNPPLSSYASLSPLARNARNICVAIIRCTVCSKSVERQRLIDRPSYSLVDRLKRSPPRGGPGEGSSFTRRWSLVASGTIDYHQDEIDLQTGDKLVRWRRRVIRLLRVVSEDRCIFLFRFPSSRKGRWRRRRSSRNGEYDNKLREWTVMRRVRRYNERINPFLPRSITRRRERERNEINRVYTRRKVRADRK